MRAESNAQAYARAEVTEADFFPSGSKPDDVYDICINYHF
jgi:hypothetical protein